jgi:menaquinone-dependent protoporphyrinogen oxidase
MRSPRTLIVYGTNYGQTARVAGRIRNVLTERGHVVTVRRGDELPADVRVADYDTVLLGASMIRHGYQKYVAGFAKRHAVELNAMSSAFFAVSGSAGSSNPAERAEARRLAEQFCVAAGWRPALIESIAGAIAYTRYSVVLRWVMKRISAKEGRSTDTTRDHEYTDWLQVDRFARQFADAVDARAGGGSAAGILAFSEATA